MGDVVAPSGEAIMIFLADYVVRCRAGRSRLNPLRYTQLRDDENRDDSVIEQLIGLGVRPAKVIRQPASVGETLFVHVCCERRHLRISNIAETFAK